MRSIELFSGAGGMAMGLAQAGIHHELLVEWNKPCVATLLHNQEKQRWMKDCKIIHGDVREVAYGAMHGKVDIVAGGPPCQPFSLGGKHGGNRDERDMFPEAVRAVRELAPKAFLFENVKGLTRPSFRPYFDYICLSLRFPEILPKIGESWDDHRKRLSAHAEGGGDSGLSYQLSWKVINAADYGIPQTRERVIFLGIRSDLNVFPNFPTASHSQHELMYEQYVTRSYWERNGIATPNEFNFVLPSQIASIQKRREEILPLMLRPWATVRESISDLPDPTLEPNKVSNHLFRPGARIYPGHIGSFIDEPAKTIKAGTHGVPGGENMIRFLDGSVRYFTVRESARIQTFPDDYTFLGTWTESMKQIGNAVPVELGKVLGGHLKSLLSITENSNGHPTRKISEAAALQPA